MRDHRPRTRTWHLLLALGVLVAGSARAQAGFGDARCASVNGGGPHCSGCPDSLFANLPNQCAPGETSVIYDLDKAFPVDPTKMSHVTIRARADSPCAAMPETTVPITGFAVGCWSPPDRDGCRVVKFLNGGTMCLNIAAQPLGPACLGDCAQVSTAQVAISTAGAAEHFVCPPLDPTTSCRALRTPPAGGKAGAGFRLWVGGFCDTNGCQDPGTSMSQVGPDTCVSSWGATFLGYAIGKSKPLGRGWYDWQSGAFKVDYRNGKSTCGKLGECLGAGNRNPWDLSLVAVPRAATPPPCLSAQTSACNASACVP